MAFTYDDNDAHVSTNNTLEPAIVIGGDGMTIVVHVHKSAAGGWYCPDFVAYIILVMFRCLPR